MTSRMAQSFGRLCRRVRAQSPATSSLYSSYKDVLGSVLFVQLTGRRPDAARRWILAEFDRLEAIFSTSDTTSDLCRWRIGLLETTTDEELGVLLADALSWQHLTGGRFNPLAGELSDLWVAAERAQLRLGPRVTLAAAAAIAQPRYGVEGQSVQRTGDCSALTLNAIAKGHIVDIVAAQACERFSLDSIVLKTGDDLFHSGHGSQTIGIKNPHRPGEAHPPLCTVSVANHAVVTSSASRRGYYIAGQAFSHILSPVTGEPVTMTAQVSIIAPAAETADVLATALMVLAPHAGLKLASSLQDIGCLIVASDGTITSNQTWRAHQVAD